MDGETTPEFGYGTLQIFLNGLWGQVCSQESLTPDAAQVACKNLGYDGGTELFTTVTTRTVGDYYSYDYFGEEVLLPNAFLQLRPQQL